MKLSLFEKKNTFFKALKTLFGDLNIPVNIIDEKSIAPQEILTKTYKDNHEAFQIMDDVIAFGMVDDAAFSGNTAESLDSVKKAKKDYDGILLFGVTLKKRSHGLLPTRTQLAEITRAFNREYYYTPVVVVFRYEDYISIANVERMTYKQEWREGEKAGKVSLLRDIDVNRPHTGHLKILQELTIARSGKNAVTNFKELYTYWQEVFSVSILNKQFYKELSDWYFWAIKHVRFPSEPTRQSLFAETGSNDNKKFEAVKQEFKAKNVIRLLTRLLFVWFIKEKGLIPEALFDIEELQKNILKEISPIHDEEGLFKESNKNSIYYKAILQNLFFATLNCPIKPDNIDSRERGFRGDESYGKHRGVDYLMRYKKYFKNPDAFLEMVNKVVPFLNGGLFECLDDKENKIYIDGFSDNMSKTDRKTNNLIVPDYIFFGKDETVDLSEDYGKKNKGAKEASVKGLINILKSYKFTIAENTPIEEDVALDPELLGRVFENLLASYNPETKTTARKQTGSFYTPREIVNYMVDESLIAHLKNSVSNWSMEEKELDKGLHQLLSFEPINPFENNTELSQEIVNSLDNCKILDPACGSGAFPMGALQKMVHVLQKVDPNNEYWQDLQLEKTQRETEGVFAIKDKEEREQRLLEINEAFDQTVNNPDYARKLFLIENCIYGVDIQPIAVQISKLRFFISLVVDQKINKNKNNLGVRPLPNLETKFVAANTLIGLDKPDAQLTLFDSQDVKQLEDKLKNVRHRLFSAKTPKTKRKLREKDKELREKIAHKLEESGWGNETARQLADWDPYDQNASSPFFDPEWMFDIADGFDVVIGNPPYASAVTMARSKEVKKLYKILYPLATGSYDIFILFLNKTIDLTKKSGQYTWIIPNKFLVADYAVKTKQYLLENGLKLSIDVSTFNVFENASVYPIVIFGDKKFKGVFKEYLLKAYTDLELRDFKKPLTLHKHKLIHCQNLKLASGATGFEASKIKGLLTEYPKDNSIPFTVSGGIDRYQITNHNIRYMGLKFEKAYVTNIKNTLADSKWYLWKRPKIIIAGMTKEIEAVFVSEGYGLGVGIYCIYNWGSFNPYYITALLNSKYLTYYLRKKFKDKHLAGGYLAINKSTLEKLPLETHCSSEVIVILSKIQHKTIIDANKTRLIDIVIDACVYEVYFPDHMKERGIDVLQYVEQDINEVMQGKDFEKLPDKQKESVIDQLYKRWTDPKNEVVKRMAMFKEKSPDILKPILES